MARALVLSCLLLLLLVAGLPTTTHGQITREVSNFPYPPVTSYNWVSPQFSYPSNLLSSNRQFTPDAPVWGGNMGPNDRCTVFVIPGTENLGGSLNEAQTLLVSVSRATGALYKMRLHRTTDDDSAIAAFSYTSNNQEYLGVVNSRSVSTYLLSSTDCSFSTPVDLWGNKTLSGWTWSTAGGGLQMDSAKTMVVFSGTRTGNFGLFKIDLSTGDLVMLVNGNSLPDSSSKSLTAVNFISDTQLLVTYRKSDSLGSYRYSIYNLPAAGSTPSSTSQLGDNSIGSPASGSTSSWVGGPTLISYKGSTLAMYRSATFFAAYDVLANKTTSEFSRDLNAMAGSAGFSITAFTPSLSKDSFGNDGQLTRFLFLGQTTPSTTTSDARCVLLDIDVNNLSSNFTLYPSGGVGQLCQGVALSAMLQGDRLETTWFIADNALNIYRYDAGAGSFAYRTASQYTNVANNNIQFAPVGAVVADVFYYVARGVKLNYTGGSNPSSSDYNTNLFGVGINNGSYISASVIQGSATVFKLYSSTHWGLPPLVLGQVAPLSGSASSYAIQPNPYQPLQRTETTSSSSGQITIGDGSKTLPWSNNITNPSILTKGNSILLTPASDSTSTLNAVNRGLWFYSYYQVVTGTLFEKSALKANGYLFVGKLDGTIECWSGIQEGDVGASSPKMGWSVNVNRRGYFDLVNTNFSFYQDQYVIVYGQYGRVMRMNMTDGTTGNTILNLGTTNNCDLNRTVVATKQLGEIFYFKSQYCIAAFNVSSMAVVNAAPKTTVSLCTSESSWTVGGGYVYWQVSGTLRAQPLNTSLFGSSTYTNSTRRHADGSRSLSSCLELVYNQETSQLIGQQTTISGSPRDGILSCWSNGIWSGRFSSAGRLDSSNAPIVWYGSAFVLANNGSLYRFPLAAAVGSTLTVDPVIGVAAPTTIADSSSSPSASFSATPWGLFLVATSNGIAGYSMWNTTINEPQADPMKAVTWSLATDPSGNELKGCSAPNYRLGFGISQCYTSSSGSFAKTYLIDVVTGKVRSMLSSGVSYSLPMGWQNSYVESGLTPQVVTFQLPNTDSIIENLYTSSSPYDAYNLPIGPYGGPQVPKDLFNEPAPSDSATLIWIFGFFCAVVAVLMIPGILVYLKRAGKQPPRPESSYQNI